MASAQPPEPTAATMLACPPRSDQGALTCASLCRIRRSVRIGARFEPGVRTEESLAGGCARGATSTAGALGSAPSVRPQSSASVGRLDEQEQHDLLSSDSSDDDDHRAQLEANASFDGQWFNKLKRDPIALAKYIKWSNEQSRRAAVSLDAQSKAKLLSCKLDSEVYAHLNRAKTP